MSIGGDFDRNDPGTVAFARWFHAMVFPGFGWAGIVGAVYLGWCGVLWAAIPLGYVTLYATCAYAWPGLLSRFWGEILEMTPAKVWESIERLSRLGVTFLSFLDLRRQSGASSLKPRARDGRFLKLQFATSKVRPPAPNTPERRYTPSVTKAANFASFVDAPPDAPPLKGVDWFKLARDGLALLWQFRKLIAVLVVLLFIWGVAKPVFSGALWLWDVTAGRFFDGESELEERTRERNDALQELDIARDRVTIGLEALHTADDHARVREDIARTREQIHADLQEASHENLDAVLAAWAAGVKRLRDDAAATRSATLAHSGFADAGEPVRAAAGA